MIVLTILVVLCICSSTAENKTFTDGIMSFNYPNFFNSHPNELNNSKMQGIGYYTSNDLLNKQYINVAKNKTNFTLIEARNSSVSKIQNTSTAEILSVTTETNPNNVVIEKIIFIDETYGEKTRHNLMYFKINDTIYGIAVYGPYSNKQVTNTANIVFQSIK